MDFRQSTYALLLASSFLLPNAYAAKKYTIYFPNRCDQLPRSEDNILEEMKNLNKVAEEQGKYYRRLEFYQNATNSGMLQEQYFRQRKLDLIVKALRSDDAETIVNSIRKEMYSMSLAFFEAKALAQKVQSVIAKEGPDNIHKTHSALLNRYRNRIRYLANHYDEYTIITQFLRKAAKQAGDEVNGKYIGYDNVLVEEYKRMVTWKAEVGTIDATTIKTGQELEDEAKAATAQMSERYVKNAAAVLKDLAPDKIFNKKYIVNYPKSAKVNFNRLPTYKEVSALIEEAGFDMKTFLLRKQNRQQRLAFWSQFRPSRLFTATLQKVARPLIPQSKAPALKAFAYSLDGIEKLFAYDATIQYIIRLNGTWAEKGIELLNRNANTSNALLIRFASRDDKAMEWYMLKSAAEKSVPPNQRLIDKMNIAEKIASRVDGTNGSPSNAIFKAATTFIDLLTPASLLTYGGIHLSFGDSETNTEEEPTPTPEPNENSDDNQPTPTPEEDPIEDAPGEQPVDEKTSNLIFNSGSTTPYVKGKDKGLDRYLSERFTQNPPRVKTKLSVAQEIALDDILDTLDAVAPAFLEEWKRMHNAKTKTESGIERKTASTPK